MNYFWKIKNKDIVFDGYFQMEKYTFEHELYAGGISGEFTREIFERGSAAAVLPYDPITDQVVLIEQFRAGAIKTMARPWMKEIVAGIIDADEQPKAVAQRESVEEAGCEVKNLELVSRYFVSPGGTTEECFLYCAEVDATTVKGIHGLAEEFEDIKVEVVSAEQAFAWVKDGTINSAAAIMALFWLENNRNRLREHGFTFSNI
ncbi:MAG: NUDIX domain-containing protein [Gammaproteobacteria bacterium]|nr:NUDIX domain-containing protein [Gammaproteobacteria bacterium]